MDGKWIEKSLVIGLGILVSVILLNAILDFIGLPIYKVLLASWGGLTIWNGVGLLIFVLAIGAIVGPMTKLVDDLLPGD